MQKTNTAYLRQQLEKAISTLTDNSDNLNWADLSFQIYFDDTEKQDTKTNWDEMMYYRVLPDKIGLPFSLIEICDLLTTATNEIPLFIKIKQTENSKLYKLTISKRFRKLVDIEKHHADNMLRPIVIE